MRERKFAPRPKLSSPLPPFWLVRCVELTERSRNGIRSEALREVDVAGHWSCDVCLLPPESQLHVECKVMASPAPPKPFGPEETRRLLHRLQTPAVFPDMAAGWPALLWTAERLSRCLGDQVVQFRLGRKEEMNAPLFETQCSYVEATLEQFLSWTRPQTGSRLGPFCEYPSSEYWAYADYKYIALLLQDRPAMFQDVRWSDFGFEGRDGRESTLWVGSARANTPCHLDSYGCNLVLQVEGRKRWHLFPPEDTAHLYPTRIPYEESSVFSQVHVVRPDLSRFPLFRGSRAHEVTLEPGQVLFVPRHWWHYVESLDPVTVSINSWIELEADAVERVGEAVAKAVVCALKSEDDPDDWLNPTEEGVAPHRDNMRSLNLALRACDRRDAGGRIRESSSDSGPPKVPFGPHLVPVRRQKDAVPPQTTGGQEVTSSGEEAPITTNDLLDCLLHPDVVARVTELLLQRHTGSDGSAPPPPDAKDTPCTASPRLLSRPHGQEDFG
uniref:HSPB1-associated protein 1 homolog isoform X2 n=1 Tax=Gasterosteus aculeatus aculeatus TaxID=481459 RepID=UPI001A994DA4|nr:HSPB1-associated protein 1 homolog isoform X2 [Gasterosteus aculeatus aculeatus]